MHSNDERKKLALAISLLVALACSSKDPLLVVRDGATDHHNAVGTGGNPGTGGSNVGQGGMPSTGGTGVVASGGYAGGGGSKTNGSGGAGPGGASADGGGIRDVPRDVASDQPGHDGNPTSTRDASADTIDAGCPVGQTLCPGCAPAQPFCAAVCPAMPCTAPDAGEADGWPAKDAATSEAGASSCSQQTTETACQGQSACHAVYVDSGTCGCASPGCCARFSRCADGANATCTQPSSFACTTAQPYCESPMFKLSYSGSCYEGCVLADECATASTVACSQVTTQSDCETRADCHSVFLEANDCGCAVQGCCMRFSRCADGGQANCRDTAQCEAPEPLCGGSYVNSYTANCYEGCVLASECAP